MIASRNFLYPCLGKIQTLIPILFFILVIVLIFIKGRFHDLF